MNKLISVILPVFNGENGLDSAVNSILSQSHHNLELIIINDGSTDKTESIINQFSDPRIRYISQENQGLAKTLNTGIKASNGHYIARMDHDDISKPTRLEKQLEFLERNPEYGMVGSHAEVWKNNKPTNKILSHPTKDAALKFFLLTANPFVHSSIMIRKSVFDTVGVYTTDPNREPPEDYELWSRISREFKVANIPECLVVYNDTDTGICNTIGDTFFEKMILFTSENLAYLAADLKLSDETFNIMSSLIHRKRNIQVSTNDYSTAYKTLKFIAARLIQQDKTAEKSITKRCKQLCWSAYIGYLYNAKYSYSIPFYRILGKLKYLFFR